MLAVLWGAYKLISIGFGVAFIAEQSQPSWRPSQYTDYWGDISNRGANVVVFLIVACFWPVLLFLWVYQDVIVPRREAKAKV